MATKFNGANAVYTGKTYELMGEMFFELMVLDGPQRGMYRMTRSAPTA